MPPVNLYYRNPEHASSLVSCVEPLREHVASQLSSTERMLNSNEVSVRMINALGSGMLADVEIDILAASNPTRVEQQDVICSNVRDFVMSQIPGLKDARVWLVLSELGYSFDR